MGTRHLIAVVCDGEYKVAQYGQWDGYPSYTGQEIAKFIRDEMDLGCFKLAVSACRYATPAEQKENWVKCGADPNDEYVSLAVSDKHTEMFPEFSRDTGFKILGLIQNDGVRGLGNSLNFVGDSLFCEWAYVLDLDKEVLEVYKGFNKEELDPNERFYHMQKESDYSPVRLFKAFPFSEVDPDAVKALEKEAYPDEDEE